MAFVSEDLNDFMREIEDYIQAVIFRLLGINEGEVSLIAGTTPIAFTTAYETGEDWDFIKRTAINADGFSIGVSITNESVTGFSVTVSEACTFKYRTSYLRNWITD